MPEKVMIAINVKLTNENSSEDRIKEEHTQRFSEIGNILIKLDGRFTELITYTYYIFCLYSIFHNFINFNTI